MNAFFMMLIFFAATNFSVFKNADKRALSAIDEKIATVVENADGSEDILFNAESGVYINKLLFDLKNETERPAKLRTTVSYLINNSDVISYDIEDINPIYVETEVLSIDKKNVISIHITEDREEGTAMSAEALDKEEAPSTATVTAKAATTAAAATTATATAAAVTAPSDRIGFSMSGFRIDNRPNISFCMLFFGAMLGLAAAAFIWYREILSRKPEYAFLLICLTMGLSMCFGLPRSKISYDEETHMQSVFAIASLPSGELHLNDDALNQVLITEYNNPDAQPASSEEMTELSEALSQKCDYKSGANTPNFSVMISRAPAYAAMAVGIKAAKLFNMGWAELILVMRISNLLMYTLLMFFAIRLTPMGKWLMMLIALFPENIFMASACSYDPFIIGCLSLGYAYMLKGRRYILPMLLFLILGCMPKAVYAPVILMGVAIALRISAKEMKPLPQGTDKPADSIKKSADSGANKKIYISAVILGIFVFAAFIAIFILPTVISPEDTGDIRGGEVSALLQVKFILSHPTTYALILLSQMLKWLRQCWFGPDSVSFMGHIINGSTDFKGFYQPYLILLLGGILLSHAHMTEKAEGESNKIIPGLGIKERSIMLLTAFAASVLIWTAMYVAFTVPGATEIAGVQGRYFTPLFFPVYLALSGTAIESGQTGAAKGSLLERLPALCYYLWGFAELILLALTIWVTVIERFCS